MEQLKSYAHNNKARIIGLLLLLICLTGAVVFVKFDYFLYSETIVKVLDVTETEYYEVNETQPSYKQEITAKVMNGSNKGAILEFENIRIHSGLKGFNIAEGDDVFVTLSDDSTVRSVQDLKRDYYAALLLAIFCFFLFLVSSKQSLLILLSTFINIGVFILIMFFRSRLYNVFLLFILGTILFTAITLLIISGVNKKSLSAIIATLLSVALMMTIAMITFKVFEDSFYYETVEFLDYIYDYKNIFYSSVLISGLGAIMDTAIIMATSINELISKDPHISSQSLKKSAWEIAQDITGTIMNVLLFSCIVGALPSIVLVVSNGMPLPFAFEYYGSVEIIRALVGSIGIILAVPISYLVNLALRRKWTL